MKDVPEVEFSEGVNATKFEDGGHVRGCFDPEGRAGRFKAEVHAMIIFVDTVDPWNAEAPEKRARIVKPKLHQSQHFGCRNKSDERTSRLDPSTKVPLFQILERWR